MAVYMDHRGYRAVRKSGVGKALEHQCTALHSAGIPMTQRIPPTGSAAQTCVVQVNTVLPGSVFQAYKARARGCKVVYYGHSTMEDFRGGFVGSELLAPLFKRWICWCYSLGDVVITPTEYSRRILLGYGLKSPVFALSNGVDTGFFHPDAERAARFRARWKLAEGEKCVISVGHWMVRKGLPDYVELARRMPQVRFLWFGHTDAALVSAEVRRAMADAPRNLTFAGYVDADALCDAYCGADAFAFLSHEETEGIVVLEALACGVPVLVRDIPVYEGWLQDGVSVYKAFDLDGFERVLKGVLSGTLPALQEGGLAVARERSLQNIGRALCEVYRQNGMLAAAQTP